jgi:protein-S-isoprenylcysteine O-methyltransferase Ste14
LLLDKQEIAMTPELSKACLVFFLLSGFFIRLIGQLHFRSSSVLHDEPSAIDDFMIGCAAVGLFVLPALFAITDWPARWNFEFSPSMAWAGCAIFSLALWLFWRSHEDLDTPKSAFPLRAKLHFNRRGVYTRIRHPMYAALFLWAVAQFTLAQNWIAGLSGFLTIYWFYQLRVDREEDRMLRLYGSEYRFYMRTTGRLLPIRSATTTALPKPSLRRTANL